MQKYMLFMTRCCAGLILCGSVLSTGLQGQSTATLFMPGIISDNGVFGLTLSPDGKTAVFVRSYGGRDSLHLYTTTFKNGTWSAPVRAPFSTAGTAWKDIDPMFSPNGKVLLFNSTRAVVQETAAKPDFDLWAVAYRKGKWGSPYHLGAVINSDSSDIYATMTKAGHIYFSSDRAGGQGKLDLYRSEYRNGAYGPPQNLGNQLNSAGQDSNPYVSPTEDYLLYWRNEPQGYGASDLYMSFRRKGTWSAPVNLGPRINTEGGEFCPFVAKKNKQLFFSRSEQRNGKRQENIYSIDFFPNQHPLP